MLLAELHTRIVAQAMWIWVVHDLNPRALSPRVKGYVEAQSWLQGLTPVSVNDRAMRTAEGRKSAVPNWYLDWQLLRKYYDGEHAYHHTVPVNLLYALDEALLEMHDEGLEARFDRHSDGRCRPSSTTRPPLAFQRRP